MNSQRNVLADDFEKILNNCQEIKKLLQEDQISFQKNDLKNLEKSNNQKLHLLNQLNPIILRVQQDLNQDPSQVPQLWHTIKAEIVQCYEYITANSAVVTANIRMLKEIFDKLTPAVDVYSKRINFRHCP